MYLKKQNILDVNLWTSEKCAQLNIKLQESIQNEKNGFTDEVSRLFKENSDDKYKYQIHSSSNNNEENDFFTKERSY